MNRSKKPYTIFQVASAIFMIIALLWLTISTPFVYASQQDKVERDRIATSQNSSADNTEDDSTNPYGNNTEEKNPNSGNSVTEEFLHDHHTQDHFFSIASRSYKSENVDTYIAYHGELLVPPPDLA
jgi:hypothetical protein